MEILSIRFSPGWINEQFGILFGDRYALAPDYRAAADADAQRKIHQRFGDLALGSAEPKPMLDLRSIFKNIVCLMYGATLRRSEDDEGWIIPREMSPQEVLAIEAPPVESSPFVQELARQGQWFVNRYGPTVWNPGIDGIINIGAALLGERFFSWFLDAPNEVDYLLKTIRHTTVDLHEYFRRQCGQPAPMGLGNCTLCMISPRQYRQAVFAHDLVWCQRAEALGIPFGFHMDGKLDPYAEVIAEFPYLHRVDMGSDTNVARVRQILPLPVFRIYLYPHQLAAMALPAIDPFLQGLLDVSGGTGRTVLQLDVCRGMSDAVVRAVAGFARRQEKNR